MLCEHLAESVSHLTAHCQSQNGRARRCIRWSDFCSIRVALTGALLLLSPLAGFSDNISAKVAGTYFSRTGKAAPSISVSLGEDGTATVTEDPGKGCVTLFGHWATVGSQIKVTFDAAEGSAAPPPMIFASSRDELEAVTWNHSDWGNSTPPVMKKGYKIKQSYWFTTVR